MANDANKTTAMLLVEQLFDKRMEDLLGEWSAEEVTFREMTRRIAERGLDVTEMTLYNWIDRLHGKRVGKRVLVFPDHESRANETCSPRKRLETGNGM